MLSRQYEWRRGSWKHVQHCSLLEKCRSILKWDITSEQPEWLLSKNPQTVNTGEGVERSEPVYAIGGNANGYRYYGECYGDSWKC